jgi:molecular chaperone DnaK
MINPQSSIVGIDLGTTNSVVAVYKEGKVQVIEEEGTSILPSVVGMTLDGKLIVGNAAKNQLAAFPERTVSSVKRRMGQAMTVKMADQEFSPQEISAMILRRLKQRAESFLGTSVTRAVITVPAFFDENQRQATREAGQLAGLTVERIINEPTAASLVYHSTTAERRHLIVYDLGGGTFDVSIVRVEDGVVEVLSSKGDTQLGGDDFDELLSKYVSDAFLTQHNFDLMGQSTTRWRLIQACERAKCELSSSGSVCISEEFIATVDGNPINLEIEITRVEYEDLIAALVERTITCVDHAIRDSGLNTSQLDELILVGGSTRTPLVQRRLREEFQRDPKWSVNPDLAVALGAATQAAMQDGHSVGPVLIDVATHTLGISALTGSEYDPELVFVPIIRRNAPLPAKYEDLFETTYADQRVVDISVFQGESAQLSRNQSIGRFRLEGLNSQDGSDGQILVRFDLTLDGTLTVTAVERQTGISKALKIDNALSQMEGMGKVATEERLEGLFRDSNEFSAALNTSNSIDEDEKTRPIEWDQSAHEMETDESKTALGSDTGEVLQPKRLEILNRARSIRESVSSDDADDIDRLLRLIETAEQAKDSELLDGLEAELEDLLFYLT